MSVRLDVIVSAVARDAGLDPDRNTQEKVWIIGWVNDVRREIANLPVRFSALEFSGEMVGVANVTAGTVNVTNLKAEVTGSSTAFVTAMAGRYISVGSEAWQRISYVTDSTHLTLESSWNGDTATSQTYKIWKRDYSLPAKVQKVLRLVDLSDKENQVAYKDPSEFYQDFGFGDSFSTPLDAYTQFGSSDLADAYVGSTIFTGVTVSAGSPLVDISSAGWVTALAPGDRLLIGNATTSTAFFVDRVLTDTRLALTHAPTISTGTTSATAHSLDRTVIRVYPANNETNVWHYEAVKKLYDLFDNADILEDGWYNAVRKGAVARALAYAGSSRAGMAQQMADAEIATLIRNQHRAQNPAIRLRPLIVDRYGRRFYGPSDRDEGY